MKYCFLVDGSPFLMHFLAKLAHRVVKDGDECIGVGIGKILEYNERKNFPKDMKFLSKVDWSIKNYQKNWQEFGELSWKEFFSTFDRRTRDDNIKFNYKNSTEITSQLYQFFNFLFQKEKPDVVIGQPPANAFTQIAYHLCKKNNIIYLGISASRLKGRVDVYDLEHTCSLYEKDFKEKSKFNISEEEIKKAQGFIKNLISHQQLPSCTETTYYSGIKGFLKHLTAKRKFQSRIKYLLNRKRFKEFDYESEGVILGTFLLPYKALRRWFRTLFQKNIFYSLDNNDIFFLFPLHLQPEASTSVSATYFCDQLATIRNIAFSLPFPYKLYVKEHPLAVGTQPGHFYQKIKKIPNVVLITPEENVKNLIKKSRGVIVLTGTIGLEAALSGKPVYVLGNTFYSYHPVCRKLNNFEELTDKIKFDLKENSIINNLDHINTRFIISYFRNTLKGDISVARKENDFNDYGLIYRGVKELISKLKR